MAWENSIQDEAICGDERKSLRTGVHQGNSLPFSSRPNTKAINNCAKQPENIGSLILPSSAYLLGHFSLTSSPGCAAENES